MHNNLSAALPRNTTAPDGDSEDARVARYRDAFYASGEYGRGMLDATVAAGAALNKGEPLPDPPEGTGAVYRAGWEDTMRAETMSWADPTPVCPRCGGPAEMIDKAPPGESGDVVRCGREATCIALAEAAAELESAKNGVSDLAGLAVDAGFDNETRAALEEGVQAWRKANEVFMKAVRAHGASRPA